VKRKAGSKAGNKAAKKKKSPASGGRPPKRGATTRGRAVSKPVAVKRKASTKTRRQLKRSIKKQTARLLSPTLLQPVAFTTAPAIFAGLDTGSFPGLNPLGAWFGQCPYTWLGYYLNSPCHSAAKYAPWMGNWRTLLQQGWSGLAILYVGHQVQKCGSADLSRGTGQAHGQSTISLMATDEQFPAGCVVFLDVEPFDPPLPQNMSDYVRGWIRALLDDGRFKPAIYCHTKNANDLLLASQQEFADAGRASGRPLFWVTHPVDSFSVSTSSPVDSGVAFADIWQGLTDTNETYNNVTLPLDANVSVLSNPSNVPGNLSQ
jgi:hypothetical protein